MTWRRPIAALAGLWVLILIGYHHDATAMVGIWWTSSTYTHCLFIAPIIAWLVWLRWPEVREVKPMIWWPGLLCLVVAGLGWLIGDAAGVSVVRHLALVMLLQSAAVLCLGPNASRALLFPIVYALFLVPFGAGMVPLLQTVTAQMCMVLLKLFGIPATIDGVFITVPGGYFKVAEACSGVKFLVAMAAYATLAANVCFRRWSRRIAFLIVAMIVPVLANGVRAFATIYVASKTDNRFAVGFDHVVYGWLFFGFVMLALLEGFWRWFDRKPGSSWLDKPVLQDAPEACHSNRTLVIAAGLIAAPLLWSTVVSASATSLPPQLYLPEVPGWHRIRMDQGPHWAPHFAGADHYLIGRYADAKGRSVDLAIAVFARQGEGHEIVGYGQGAVDPAGNWSWTDDRPGPKDSRAFRITAPGSVVRDVVTFYRVGSVTTGSEVRVKFETLRAKLFGGPQRAVAVLISAQEPAEDRSARPEIDAFLSALGPIDRVVDHLIER